MSYFISLIFVSVKADGAKTDCLTVDGNCATDATCSVTTCSCDAGFIAAASGLCTGGK